MRERVYKRDGHRCVACGATSDLTLDHVVPVSRGGSNRQHNLQTMCRPCNEAKGAGPNKPTNETMPAAPAAHTVDEIRSTWNKA